MNTLKNLAKKAIAVTAGVLMVGSTTVGALAAADLKDYPAPFVMNGQFNGLIVVGEKAATQDVLGSIEIAGSLQAASTTATSGGSSTTSMGGDSKMIGDAADMLELGEYYGDVTEVLTEDDLMFLKGGVMSTDEGDTDFVQTIEFDPTWSFGDANHGKVGLYKDNEDDTGVFFFFNDRDEMFRYELEFTSGLESDVDANGALEDIEDETLFVLGQYFSVVDSDSTDAAGSDDVSLELIAGDVTDTLREGETKTYTVDGKQYEVTLLIVSDNQDPVTAKFLVNGESTDSLEEGETDKVAGLDIGVREVLANEGTEANGSDLAEFYLGANKLELADTDTDSAGGGSVKVNGETIDDATLEITATVGAADATINKLEYTLEGDAENDQDLYLTKGQGIREFLDEPEGMLADEWDIVFQGTSDPGYTDIMFSANGDDQMDLEFTSRTGDTYTVAYAAVDPTNNEIDWASDAEATDEEESFIFWEMVATGAGVSTDPAVEADYPIFVDDYFVLTKGTAGVADDNDDTNILQFTDIDDSEGTITFDDMSTGREIKASFTAGSLSVDETAPSTAQLTVSGKTFQIWFYDAGTGDYRVAVDADGSGDYGAADGVYDTTEIVVKGGGIIGLGDPSDTTDGSWDVTLTTLDDNMDDATADQVTTLTFTATFATTDELDSIAVAGTPGYFAEEDVDGEDRSLSLDLYGVWGDVTEDTDEADSITLRYPDEQVGAILYVTGGGVQSTTTSNAGGVRVNPLGVGFSVLDSEVTDSQYGSKNMIVVGGPCANTIAARLLGNPAVCYEGFMDGKATLKLFDNGQRVAVLAAGYSAQDTQGAARVLAQYDDYALMGTEATLTVTSVNNVRIS